MPNGYLQNAELALREAVNAPPSTNAFREHSRNIYHADIQLRQFAKPLARFLALGFLGLGVALMIVPTALNVIGTLIHFLPT
jgi:hypothetical protein